MHKASSHSHYQAVDHHPGLGSAAVAAVHRGDHASGHGAHPLGVDDSPHAAFGLVDHGHVVL